MPANSYNLAIWLNANTNADSGLALVLLLAACVLSWLIVCRYVAPRFLPMLRTSLTALYIGALILSFGITVLTKGLK